MTTAGAHAETTLLAATDAGMHALWNPACSTGITDYETWENALPPEADAGTCLIFDGNRPTGFATRLKASLLRHTSAPHVRWRRTQTSPTQHLLITGWARAHPRVGPQITRAARSCLAAGDALSALGWLS
jgi:hypothetical protein